MKPPTFQIILEPDPFYSYDPIRKAKESGHSFLLLISRYYLTGEGTDPGKEFWKTLRETFGQWYTPVPNDVVRRPGWSYKWAVIEHLLERGIPVVFQTEFTRQPVRSTADMINALDLYYRNHGYSELQNEYETHCHLRYKRVPQPVPTEV
jgi:hypothetical protein